MEVGTSYGRKFMASVGLNHYFVHIQLPVSVLDGHRCIHRDTDLSAHSNLNMEESKLAVYLPNIMYLARYVVS